MTTESPMGGRVGTLFATREQIEAVFGPPNITYPKDGKVTCSWCFRTPRGPAEVRDYWWNAPGEWSLATGGFKATLWLRRMLRRNGLCQLSLLHVVRP